MSGGPAATKAIGQNGPDGDGCSYLRSGKLLRSATPPGRRRSEFVKVSVGRRRWYCGREALAAASDYFGTMLGADYRERRLGEIRIPEGGTPVTQTAFEKIVRYVNGGELQVHDDAVDLLFACSYLQIRSADSRLFEAIGRASKMSDLVRLYAWPELGNAAGCRETVRRLICSRFETTPASYFRPLPFNVLKEILAYPDLVFRHYKLIDCVITWIAFDAQQRLPFAAHLMRIIYWNFRPPHTFGDVLAGVVRCDDKHDYLRFVVHNVLYQRPKDVLLGTSLFFTQFADDQPVRLEYSVDIRPLPFVTNRLSELEATLLGDDIFVALVPPLPPLPQQQQQQQQQQRADSVTATATATSSATSSANRAIDANRSWCGSGNGRAVGGCDSDRGRSHRFFRCDTDTFEWQELRPTRGHCHDLVACGDTVYAYQECNGSYFLEAYVAAYDNWLPVPASRRVTCSAGIAAGHRQVYAVSANVSNATGAKYCIQMYDCRCRQWELLHCCAEMGVYTRSFAKQTLLLDHSLYIFHQNSFDMMEMRMLRWSQPLPTRRYPQQPRYAFSLPRLPVVVADTHHNLSVYDVNECCWSQPVNPFYGTGGAALKPGFIPLF